MPTLLETLQARAAAVPPPFPLRLLVVSGCAGAGTEAPPANLTAVGIDGLLSRFQPTIAVAVDDLTGKTTGRLSAALPIRSLDDFTPQSLAARVDFLGAAAGSPRFSEQLDAVLHHPEVQRSESSLRGLDRLLREVQGTSGIRLEFLPADRKNLQDRFHRLVFEPEYAGTPDIPLSAVYFDFRFSHEPVDLPLLEALAADCAALQVPMIAAVSPAFFQLRNLAHLPNLPDLAAKLEQAAYANWRRFQAGEPARWVCLTANRFLAREPHRLSGLPGMDREYSESADAAHPERYLWAEAGWLVLANLARSFSRYRHCAILDGMSPATTHPSLPVRPIPVKANVEVPSPTEVLISDDKAWEIVRSGISMLVGISDGAVATFPLLTNAYRLRPGVLTTECALSYQMFAGNLFHYLIQLCGELPAEGDPEIAAFVGGKLREFLVPFDGDDPEQSVRVGVEQAPGDPARRLLSIRVRPFLKVQGKDVDFTFQLAL